MEERDETDKQGGSDLAASEGPHSVVDPTTLLLRSDSESDSDKRWSHGITYFTVVTASIGFSVILTGVWPYLRSIDESVSKELLGFVIAMNPIGQCLASPLFGLWASRSGSFRLPFIATVLLFIAGNVLYATLVLYGKVAMYVMCFSRFIVGVSSASVALARSYIGSSTSHEERTKKLGYVGAAQAFGFAVGPGLQSLISTIPFSHFYCSNHSDASTTHDDSYYGRHGVYHINMYSFVGWCSVILGLINLVLFLPSFFKEDINLESNGVELSPRATTRLNLLAAFGLLSSFFATMFIFVLLETVLVPMCLDMFAWTQKYAVTFVGIFLSVIGLLGILCYYLAHHVSKKIDERKVLIMFGLAPMFIGMIVQFPVSSNYPRIYNCTDVDLARWKSRKDLMYHNIPISNGLAQSHISLNASEQSCDNLGCPADQEWCKYTPIVEVPQVITGNIVTFLGCPFALTLINSLFSKLLSNEKQGFWMGMLTSAGSLARTTGPLFVTFVYAEYGPRWMFAILAFIVLLAMSAIAGIYERLVPGPGIPTTSVLQNVL